jgi:hypothetical protein
MSRFSKLVTRRSVSIMLSETGIDIAPETNELAGPSSGLHGGETEYRAGL